MMKKLLLLFTTILTVFALNAQTNSMTIIAGTTPSSIEIGETVTVTIEYTLVGGTNQQLAFGYNLVDSGGGYISSGPAQYVALGTAGTTSPQTVEVSFTAAGDTSADLTGGNKFVYNVAIQDTDNGYATLASDAINGADLTVTEASVPLLEVTDLTTTSPIDPATTTFSITFDYANATVDDVINVQIKESNGSGGIDWGSDTYAYGANVAFDAIGSGTQTINLDLGSGGGSPALSNGQELIWVLQMPNTGGEETLLFDVSSTASLKDINANSIVMYPNPVSNKLYLKSNHLDIKSLKINDLLGKEVLLIDNTHHVESIDVSTLSKGVYILTTDTNKQLKFIKK